MHKRRADSSMTPVVPSPRAQAGNMLFLIVAAVALLLAVVFFGLNYTHILGVSEEHKTAIEAACLAAAKDLTRIVVNDPNYGYISLSDYPAVGPATTAGDGEPLPVMSINTLLGTARLDLLVADSLGNETMRQLARKDADNTKQAVRLLAGVLQKSLEPGGTDLAKDMDGNPVTPYEDAKQLYERNQPAGSSAAGSLKLTLGVLSSTSDTITLTPQPADMAQLPPNTEQDGKYRAFINVPASGVDFYFAGISDNPRLVDPHLFAPDDGIKTPSIVLAEADRKYTQYDSEGKPQVSTVHDLACAQPAGFSDSAVPGALSLSFPSGIPPGINSPADLAQNPQLKINKTTLLTPPAGDFPTDTQSLVPTSVLNPEPTVSEIWATGFYHWVRKGHTKPNVKDLKQMQQDTFDSMGLPGSGPDQVARAGFELPAYAGDSSRQGNIQTGILSVQFGGQEDPRLQAVKQGTQEGVRAYWGMAGYASVQSQLPPSALMVGVTPDGQITSADGKAPVDTALIQSFWARVAESNSAGLAALAMGTEVARLAKLAVDKDNQQIDQAKSAITQLNEQLQSGRLSFDQAQQAQGQIAQLNNQITALLSNIDQQKQFIQAAQNAITNGSAVATASDTIVRNQRALTARGLSQVGSTFELAGVKIVPHPVPPTSLDAIRYHRAPSGDSAPTDWTAGTGFYFYAMPAIKVTARPPAPGMLPPAYAQSLAAPSQSRMYLYEFDENGHVICTVLPASPFTNLVVSQNQDLAISMNALTTGTDIPVVWAMACRDQCVKLGKEKGGKHAGEILAGAPANWKGNSAYGNNRGKNPKDTKPKPVPKDKIVRTTYTGGGLAVDFQIRTPLVGNCGFPTDTANLLSTSRASDLVNVPINGPALLQAFGLSLPIPNTSNLLVKASPGQVGPGKTIAPGGDTPSSECPSANSDLW